MGFFLLSSSPLQGVFQSTALHQRVVFDIVPALDSASTAACVNKSGIMTALADIVSGFAKELLEKPPWKRARKQKRRMKKNTSLIRMTTGRNAKDFLVERLGRHTQ